MSHVRTLALSVLLAVPLGAQSAPTRPLDPNNVGALRQMGQLYRKNGNWQQLGATLTRALDVAVSDVDPTLRVGHAVCRRLRGRGVILRPLGDVIVLMPPLSITEPEITQLVDAIEFGIREICP